MPREKLTATTVTTGDKAEPISGSPMTAFDAFVEENFAKRKRLAQLDRTQLAEAWARNWNLFWEQCEKDFPGMNTLEIQAALFKSQFDFVSAQRFADKLSTNRERLAFFITAKTRFDQSGPQDFLTRRGLLDQEDLRFGGKCDLEISKYKQLVELDAEKATEPDEDDPEQLRRRVIILLIDELIPKFSELIPAKKAEFLALLTGLSKKGFELIVEDHLYAGNIEQTRRTASEWLDKLK